MTQLENFLWGEKENLLNIYEKNSHVIYLSELTKSNYRLLMSIQISLYDHILEAIETLTLISNITFAFKEKNVTNHISYSLRERNFYI